MGSSERKSLSYRHSLEGETDIDKGEDVGCSSYPNNIATKATGLKKAPSKPKSIDVEGGEVLSRTGSAHNFSPSYASTSSSCPLAFLDFTPTDLSERCDIFNDMLHIPLSDYANIPITKYTSLHSELTLVQSTILNRTHELQEELRKLEVWMEYKQKMETSKNNVDSLPTTMDGKGSIGIGIDTLGSFESSGATLSLSQLQKMDSLNASVSPTQPEVPRKNKIGRPRRKPVEEGDVSQSERWLRPPLRRHESSDSRRADDDDIVSLSSFVSADGEGCESDNSVVQSTHSKSYKSRKRRRGSSSKGPDSVKKRRLKSRVKEEEVDEYGLSDDDTEHAHSRRKPTDSHIFWQYYEPYFAHFTKNDLDNLIVPTQREEGYDAAIYDIPPIGHRYNIRWQLEDKLSNDESVTSTPVSMARSRRGTESDPLVVKAPDEEISVSKEEIGVQDNGCGPLMRKWLSLLIELPPESPPIGSNSNKIAARTEGEIGKLNICSGIELRGMDERLKDKMIVLGLLMKEELPDLENHLYPDEIGSEIRQLQQKLREQISTNNKRRKKMYNQALQAMEREEIEVELEESEHAIVLAFRKRMMQKKRKQAANKSTIDYIRKILMARQTIMERYEEG